MTISDLVLLELRADLRTGQADHEEEKGQRIEYAADPALGAGTLLHQRLHQGLVAHGAHPILPQTAQDGLRHEEERDQQQKQQIAGCSEDDHTNLLLLNKRNNASSRSRISAARAYPPKSSL